MPGGARCQGSRAVPKGSQKNGMGVLIQGYNVMREEQDLKAEAKRRRKQGVGARSEARKGGPGKLDQERWTKHPVDQAPAAWRSLSKVHA